jgi:hypothetical protein
MLRVAGVYEHRRTVWQFKQNSVGVSHIDKMRPQNLVAPRSCRYSQEK